MKEVSFYMPCFNAAPYLDRSVEAVMAQTWPVREVIVIDDGSTDETLETAMRLGRGARLPLRVVQHGRNRGLGAARQTGLMECRSEYVASVDADVAPASDWLEQLMAEFESGSEALVGVGGDLIEHFRTTVGDAWRNAHMRQSWGPRRVLRPPFLYGSNTVFRKDVLLQAGGYDERCRTAAEDVNICEKICDQFLLIYTPRARCFHLREDTPSSVARNHWRWHYYGNHRPVSLSRTIKANLSGIKRAAGLLLQDLGNDNPVNAAVSLYYLVAAPYWDWRAYLSAHAEKNRYRSAANRCG